MKKIKKIVKWLFVFLLTSTLLLVMVATVWYFSNRVAIPPLADTSAHAGSTAPGIDSKIVQIASGKISTLREESSHPAVSVCVAKRGDIVWTEAQGYACISEKRLATVESQFPIGSVTKPMTALAAMILVEQGKLDLDKDIREYVPEFPQKQYVITPRQLLSHQAGIRHYRIAWYPPLFTEMGINTNYDSIDDSLELFADDQLEFEPDSAFLYTTYGYTLLGAAMEKASGKTYLDWMQDSVLNPLGLKDTVPDKFDSSETQNWTSKYMSVSSGVVLNSPKTNCSNKWAGGGYRSTPTDLVRFGSAVLDNAIVSEASSSLMFQPRMTTDGKINKQRYGLGWRVGQIQSSDSGRTFQMIHHGGTTVGAQCALVLLPEHEIVVAICANSYSGGSGEVLNTAASIAVQFVDPE